MNEALFVHVLLYGSEIMIMRKKERSRIKAVQMDNLRGFLGIMKRDRVPNVRIRELYCVVKGLMKN